MTAVFHRTSWSYCRIDYFLRRLLTPVL